MPRNKHNVLSFEDASIILGNRDTKKLAVHTYLSRKNNDEFVIRYHSTNIVTIHRNGTYSLNTNGHHTVTTKRRLNEYSPVAVSQSNYNWYIHCANGVLDFEDGMRVSRNGELQA